MQNVEFNLYTHASWTSVDNKEVILAAESGGKQVIYHMYLASGRWLSYTPSIERAVGWAIHKMQPVS